MGNGEKGKEKREKGKEVLDMIVEVVEVVEAVEVVLWHSVLLVVIVTEKKDRKMVRQV